MSTEILATATMLWLIMDPLGNLPVIISILKDIDPAKHKKILLREMFFALVILILFLYAGQGILSFLHIGAESLRITGGIILFIIALKMIFPPESGNAVGMQKGEEPYIVPIAMPLVAGPSVIAALMLMAGQEPERMNDYLIATLIAWFGTLIIFMGCNLFAKVLGEKGLKAVERFMGLLLVMLSVQMLLDGVKDFFQI